MMMTTMRSKDTFSNVQNVLLDNDNIVIFPHIVADGDTIGSSVALCAALKSKGKKVKIVIEDEIPRNLSFLVTDDFVRDIDYIDTPTVCVSLDSSDIGRIGNRHEIFNKGSITVNIDHHPTNTAFAQYNYVDDESAATGEIIYDLIESMGITFNDTVAEGLYVAIASDTGNFMNSNTTKKSHLYTANLFDFDVDIYKINVELFQNFRKEKYYILADLWGSLDFYYNESVVIGYLTQKRLHEMGAKLEETDGAIDYLKSIYGVEIAVFIKELEDNVVKVSMRSKSYADVSKIAFKYGGGGHKKAAGFTLNHDVNTAKKMIVNDIDQMINE